MKKHLIDAAIQFTVGLLLLYIGAASQPHEVGSSLPSREAPGLMRVQSPYSMDGANDWALYGEECLALIPGWPGISQSWNHRC